MSSDKRLLRGRLRYQMRCAESKHRDDGGERSLTLPGIMYVRPENHRGKPDDGLLWFLPVWHRTI